MTIHNVHIPRLLPGQTLGNYGNSTIRCHQFSLSPTGKVRTPSPGPGGGGSGRRLYLIIILCIWDCRSTNSVATPTHGRAVFPAQTEAGANIARTNARRSRLGWERCTDNFHQKTQQPPRRAACRSRCNLPGCATFAGSRHFKKRKRRGKKGKKCLEPAAAAHLWPGGLVRSPRRQGLP